MDRMEGLIQTLLRHSTATQPSEHSDHGDEPIHPQARSESTFSSAANASVRPDRRQHRSREVTEYSHAAIPSFGLRSMNQPIAQVPRAPSGSNLNPSGGRFSSQQPRSSTQPPSSTSASTGGPTPKKGGPTGKRFDVGGRTYVSSTRRILSAKADITGDPHPSKPQSSRCFAIQVELPRGLQTPRYSV